MNFKGNDPIYPKLSDPESTDIYHQNITRGETSLSASNRYGKTDGTVRAYYSYGNHYIDDPRHFHSLDDRLGVLAYQNYSPTESTVLTLGFDFARYTGKIPMSGGTAHKPGAMGTIDRKVINEYSPYLTASQSLWQDQLVVTAGLRMANSDMFGTKWVPQFGVSASPAHLFTIKASAAMGYRNPSFRELYLYRMANPDLQPEKMWNYEVSLQKSFGTILDATLTAYYSRGSNMIQVVDMKTFLILLPAFRHPEPHGRTAQPVLPRSRLERLQGLQRQRRAARHRVALRVGRNRPPELLAAEPQGELRHLPLGRRAPSPRQRDRHKVCDKPGIRHARHNRDGRRLIQILINNKTTKTTHV